MPVGVPYVEYQLPGNPEPEWINMYNALYRERMLFLCQEIEDTISNELIGLMLYLNADDPSRALFLYINSPGGSVTCGIGIYDIMRYLNSGITTICMGTAASMASFILTGGTYGRRIALPNSRIMIHQPEGGSDGQATEILSESSEVARIRRQVGLIYANRTQQSIERIAQDLDRDQFMSAYEAKEYGLIDFVARSQKEEYEPGYDLLGINSDNFQIPAFLKKLALG
jgi:ATP-dependent Clp protease protease subunit